MKFFRMMTHLSVFGLVLSAAVAADRSVATSGLWRAAHADKSTAYLCIDHNYQPWRMLPVAKYGPPVGVGSFREPNGTIIRYVVRLERRDWAEASTYGSETTYTLQHFHPGDAKAPTSGTATKVARSWKGNFASRLEFRETMTVVATDADPSKALSVLRDSAVMTRVGACPANMAPGQKCRVTKSASAASSEWPACDSAVARPSR
jgi:hypothetical protein